MFIKGAAMLAAGECAMRQSATRSSVFNGETKRLIINIRAILKAEIAVVNFIAWAMGRVPDCEFIHASYSAALAVNNSRTDSELGATRKSIGRFFLIWHWRAKHYHWKTTAGGVMYATGAGGTITGFGAGRHREDSAAASSLTTRTKQMKREARSGGRTSSTGFKTRSNPGRTALTRRLS
ncbi:hypothetical protein ND436_002565 [Neisseria gonorrhoeae]|nr:hypothetical protein ND436_002565 [Neisseria gonorrhoeae]